jgi:hypothetical protein
VLILAVDNWGLQVTQVVLVELANAPVQHALTTRVILEQIAPHAKLHILHATSDKHSHAAPATS